MWVSTGSFLHDQVGGIFLKEYLKEENGTGLRGRHTQLWRLRQEDHKFKASLSNLFSKALSNTVRSCLKIKHKTMI